MDLQISKDSPEVYNSTRGRGRRVHLSQEDADAIYRQDLIWDTMSRRALQLLTKITYR